MSRGELTDKVISFMKLLGFEGTKEELRLMPYLMCTLLDNRYPTNINAKEKQILDLWKEKDWIIDLSRTKPLKVTEDLLDKMYDILKLSYLSDVLKYKNYTDTVLFEGSDGSGKSTLMDRLRNDAELHHCYIYDRGVFSDIVYANKFNRKVYQGVDMQIYETYHKQKLLAKPNLKIVLCTAKPEVLSERCFSKKDELTSNKSSSQVIEELKTDNDLFNDEITSFCNDNDIPLLILDTDIYDIDTCVSNAKSFIIGDVK